jgi:hypothetical protein
VDRAPFSQSLIADDERTFLASAELRGGPVVPSAGIATCFTGDSSWHTRLGPAIPGLTVWTDLEPRTAGTGALRLVPGSHVPEYERQLRAYCRAAPAASGYDSRAGRTGRTWWSRRSRVTSSSFTRTCSTAPGAACSLRMSMAWCTDACQHQLSTTFVARSCDLAAPDLTDLPVAARR